MLYDLKIFEWVEDYLVDRIVAEVPKETYNKWDIILNEWEKTNWKAYVIDYWNVEVFHKGKKIGALWRWEMFWEMALLREEDRNAKIVATSDVKLIVLDLDDLIEIINNDDNLINKEIMKRIKENIENEN